MSFRTDVCVGSETKQMKKFTLFNKFDHVTGDVVLVTWFWKGRLQLIFWIKFHKFIEKVEKSVVGQDVRNGRSSSFGFTGIWF